MKAKILTLLVLCSASVLADDFKTIDGKEYKNAKLSRVEPDGIVLMKKSGISKVYFTELPKEVQERFHYDAEQAAAYSSAQNAKLEMLRKQQGEALRQKEETTRKNNEQLTKEQTGIQWTREQRQKAQALQDRLQQLHQEEDDMRERIREAERLPAYLSGRSGNKYYSYPNPARQYIPDWQDRLNQVRREKDQLKQQLKQAQH
jgi:chromosome segregation ATPase